VEFSANIERTLRKLKKTLKKREKTFLTFTALLCTRV